MTPNAGAVKEGEDGAAARSSAEQFNYRHPGSTVPENDDFTRSVYEETWLNDTESCVPLPAGASY